MNWSVFWSVVAAIVFVLLWRVWLIIILAVLGGIVQLISWILQIIGGILYYVFWWPFEKLFGWLGDVFGAKRYEYKPIRRLSVFRWNAPKVGETYISIHGTAMDSDYRQYSTVEVVYRKGLDLQVKITDTDGSFLKWPRHEVGSLVWVKPWQLFEFIETK